MNSKPIKYLISFLFLVGVALIPQMVLAGGFARGLDSLAPYVMAYVFLFFIWVIFTVKLFIKNKDKNETQRGVNGKKILYYIISFIVILPFLLLFFLFSH